MKPAEEKIKGEGVPTTATAAEAEARANVVCNELVKVWKKYVPESEGTMIVFGLIPLINKEGGAGGCFMSGGKFSDNVDYNAHLIKETLDAIRKTTANAALTKASGNCSNFGKETNNDD